MTATKSAKTAGSKKKAQPELTEEEQRELFEREKQTKEQRAENQLDLAKLFLAKDQPEIAVRRLKEVVAQYCGTAVAEAAKVLIRRL